MFLEGAVLVKLWNVFNGLPIILQCIFCRINFSHIDDRCWLDSCVLTILMTLQCWSVKPPEWMLQMDSSWLEKDCYYAQVTFLPPQLCSTRCLVLSMQFSTYGALKAGSLSKAKLKQCNFGASYGQDYTVAPCSILIIWLNLRLVSAGRMEHWRWSHFYAGLVLKPWSTTTKVRGGYAPTPQVTIFNGPCFVASDRFLGYQKSQARSSIHCDRNSQPFFPPLSPPSPFSLPLQRYLFAVETGNGSEWKTKLCVEEIRWWWVGLHEQPKTRTTHSQIAPAD